MRWLLHTQRRLPSPPSRARRCLAAVFVPTFIAEKSTTVYVGKIASSVPDSVIRTLLEACGRVRSWKRQEDPDTKQLKGFGFCEFEDAEGVLRALRLLNNLKLDGQELLLKCNAATLKYTEQYETRKAAEKAERQAAKAAAKEAAAAAKAEGEASGDGKPEEEGALPQAEEAEEEDEDAAADNRVLEVVMGVVSDRAERSSGPPAAAAAPGALPPPPPLEGSSAQAAASEFLAQLGSGATTPAPSTSARDVEREVTAMHMQYRTCICAPACTHPLHAQSILDHGACVRTGMLGLCHMPGGAQGRAAHCVCAASAQHHGPRQWATARTDAAGSKLPTPAPDAHTHARTPPPQLPHLPAPPPRPPAAPRPPTTTPGPASRLATASVSGRARPSWSGARTMSGGGT